MLAALAEIIGTELRPAGCGFRDAQADFIGRCLDRVRVQARSAIICVPIAAAGDCVRLMSTVAERKAHSVVKSKMDRALCKAVALRPFRKTVDVDARGHALTRVAEVLACGLCGSRAGLTVRVIARRRREHTSGRQTALWERADWITQVFLTDNPATDPADIP